MRQGRKCSFQNRSPTKNHDFTFSEAAVRVGGQGHISFNVRLQNSQEDWLDFFRRHPKLEILKFPYTQATHVEDVLDLLARAVPDTQSSSAFLPMPKLRMISFQQTLSDELSTSSVLDCLTTALLHRSQQGVPITTLEFLQCFGLNPSKLAEMKKRVSGVTKVIESDFEDDAEEF